MAVDCGNMKLASPRRDRCQREAASSQCGAAASSMAPTGAPASRLGNRIHLARFTCRRGSPRAASD